MEEKVSIIIPVYNVEDYIVECIESCLAQTYSNYEIIIVDDGSSDGSGELCDEISKKDERVFVLHQENQGLSVARNNGLDIAKGDYIAFLDGDDFIAPNMLENSLSAIRNSNIDIVFFEFYNGIESRKDTNIKKNDNNTIINSEECIQLLLQHKLGDVVWNGLYKRSVICDIKFPEGKIAEDVFWKYKAIINAKKIVLIPDYLYYYRIRNGSITNSLFSWKHLDALEGLYIRALEIPQYYPELKVLTYSEVWSKGLLYFKVVEKRLHGDESVKAKKLILGYRRTLPLKLKEILREPRISKMRKVELILAKICFRCTAWLMDKILKIKYR